MPESNDISAHKVSTQRFARLAAAVAATSENTNAKYARVTKQFKQWPSLVLAGAKKLSSLNLSALQDNQLCTSRSIIRPGNESSHRCKCNAKIELYALPFKVFG